MNDTPCLKNAWIRKDADGHYFLFIRAGNGKSAMLNLTAMNPSLDEQIKAEINPAHGESDLVREALESWLAQQDQSLVKVERGEDFPDTIDADN